MTEKTICIQCLERHRNEQSNKTVEVGSLLKIEDEQTTWFIPHIPGSGVSRRNGDTGRTHDQFIPPGVRVKLLPGCFRNRGLFEQQFVVPKSRGLILGIRFCRWPRQLHASPDHIKRNFHSGQPLAQVTDLVPHIGNVPPDTGHLSYVQCGQRHTSANYRQYQFQLSVHHLVSNTIPPTI